jgi:hypothetical protein
MADEAPKSGDEIPTLRFATKKVDDSWKEEARREKEAAARAAAGGSPTSTPRQADQQSGAPQHAPQQAQGGKPAEAASSPSRGEASAGADDEEGKADQKQLSPQEQQHTKIFMNFLAGLAQQALMQLGEIESPFTGQRELDLNGARYTIELLAVIQQRTKGNLVGEEPQLLEETIADLKMRYVELAQELQRQMAAQMAKGGPGGAGGPGGMPGGRRK